MFVTLSELVLISRNSSDRRMNGCWLFLGPLFACMNPIPFSLQERIRLRLHVVPIPFATEAKEMYSLLNFSTDSFVIRSPVGVLRPLSSRIWSNPGTASASQERY